MLKKIIALLLCLLMMIPVLSACATRDENDLGPMITMYLADEIYNLTLPMHTTTRARSAL